MEKDKKTQVSIATNKKEERRLTIEELESIIGGIEQGGEGIGAEFIGRS
jgi:bacteriocin-like protein